MTLVTALEVLATDTWGRLEDSRRLGIRFGEETITDLLLLDLGRKHSSGSQVLQTPKVDESKRGTDWEWWIGSRQRGWLRMAIQAKKMDVPNARYKQLGHKVGHKAGSELQIDVLERYAIANRAIPMYCLYNHVEGSVASSGWRCCDPCVEISQLACTITTSSVVRRAMAKRGGRNFASLHASSEALPWRCLAKCKRLRVACPLPGAETNQPREPRHVQLLEDQEIHIHGNLPAVVEAAMNTGRMEHFDNASYDSNVGLYPRRVVVSELPVLEAAPPNAISTPRSA